MTIEEKRNYLKRYKAARDAAEDIKLRQEELRQAYACPKPIRYSDMPKGHDTEHDLSDFMAKWDELQRDLWDRQQECIRLMREISVAIDRMKDGNEKRVLMLRYIDCLKWEEIEERTHYSYPRLQAIHKCALVNFRPLKKHS